MSSVLYRGLTPPSTLIESGNGAYLNTHDGRQLMDLSSGPCFSSLGHSNQAVIDAMCNQAGHIPNVFGGFWASYAAEDAGDTLASLFEVDKPSWFGKVIFQCGGGEAIDLTCKLAAQYHLEAGKKVKTWFAVRDYAYHGVGLLPFAMSGSYPRYKMMDPYHAPAKRDYVLRIPSTFDHSAPDAINQTTQLLDQWDDVAAIVIEPVGGPPIGAHTEVTWYLQALRRLCDERDILLIFDEILCGAGRCGYLSVAAAYDVWPDITVLGKGLSAGYQPVTAICLSNKIIERLEQGSKSVMFGTAYSAHTMGCAAVAAALDYMRGEHLFERVRENAAKMQLALQTMPHCEVNCFVRGMGYLWGIELRDPTYNGMFNPQTGFHARAREAIMQRGAVVYSKGQTVNGERDFLIVAPPFEITMPELSVGISMVRDGINDAFKALKAGE